MESLHELNVQPTLIVIIDAADDVILRRLTLRRTDPITGQSYASSDDADREVKPRLIVAPNEKREIV